MAKKRPYNPNAQEIQRGPLVPYTRVNKNGISEDDLEEFTRRVENIVATLSPTPITMSTSRVKSKQYPTGTIRGIEAATRIKYNRKITITANVFSALLGVIAATNPSSFWSGLWGLSIAVILYFVIRGRLLRYYNDKY